MIDTLKHGALVFAYYPDREWLAGVVVSAVRADVRRQRRWPALADTVATRRERLSATFSGSAAS